MHRTQVLAAVLAAGAVSVTATSAARADSVAYVKGGNVYLAPGDLSREFQVTTTGGYSAVSQADDGTLLATAGGDLRRLDRFGNVLSDILTPASGQGNTGLDAFYGPFDADISPNGQTAAYGYVHSGWSTSGGVADFEQRNGTGFTNPAALTGFTDAGFHFQSDWDAPEFVDDQTVLLSDGPGYPSDPISIETVGSNDPRGWFTDPDNPHPLDATISRNRRLIAAVVGPDRQGLSVYRDQDGQLLGAVNKCFTYSDHGTYKYESPTFNADGTRLYWSDGTDLQTASVGDMSTTCADGLPGGASFAGTSPDWGPADAPSGRPGPLSPGGTPTAGTPTSGTPTSGAPTPGTPSGHAPGKRGSPDATHRRRVRLRLLAATDGSLGRGVIVRVRTSRAGVVVVSARVAGTTVATARTRARRPGVVGLKLTLTANGRRALRHRHGRVALLLTATEGKASAVGRLARGR